MLTQHWFSGTRATVSFYRMQRESDVCESVCEAGVLVHGGRRCRACHLCMCAQRVCVCARTHTTISMVFEQSARDIVVMLLRYVACEIA